MTVTKACRLYAGLTQQELGDAVGVHVYLIKDIEKVPPAPSGSAYKLVADYLGLPCDVVLQDDFTAIPAGFFARWPQPEYAPEPLEDHKRIGREGEEFILSQERERVGAKWPALAQLIMPFFKLHGKFGCDILSFDDRARPVFLEVKTSIHSSPNNGISMTAKELRMAQNCLAAGEKYILCTLTNWGSPQQKRQDIPFETLEAEYDMQHTGVRFRRKPRCAKDSVSGIAYHRKRKGLNQTQLAALIGTRQCAICLYESGKRTPSLQVLRRLSAVLDVAIDDLVQTYEVAEDE